MIMMASGQAFGRVKMVGVPIDCPNGKAVSLLLDCNGGSDVSFVAYRKMMHAVEELHEGDLVAVDYHPFSKSFERRDGTMGHHTTLAVDGISVCARSEELGEEKWGAEA